jgi:NAD(P)-dependent dehydrogenase (short-subunit alcohol dehydrogenase family)
VVVQDLGAPEAAARIVDAAVRHGGRLDGVVNNAGAARFAPLEIADIADLDTMLAVNVKSPAMVIKHAYPHLKATRGAVVNVTSVAGSLSMPGRSFYGASKAAINSLTRSLALELAPEVRVNAILPGPVETPLWTSTGMTEDQLEDLRQNLAASTPIGRFGEPGEVAFWACLLLDRQASGWMTGALIPVDGGRML